VIDWVKVRAAGYAFAVIKVTGGNVYVNPHWREQYEGARAAGMVTGFYHYDGEPSVQTGTATEEAAHFLRNLPNPLPPDVFLALDAEERATRDPGRYRDWLLTVRLATGKTPFIYTFQSFVTELGPAAWEPVKDFPLWFAWYPDVIDPLPPRPVCPLPWTEYKAWQYSGGTTISGIPKATDANVFFGTREELAGGTGTTIGKKEDTGADPDPIVARSYIDAKGRPVTIIEWGGEMTEILGTDFKDVGIRGRNKAGAIHHRSIIDGQGQAYVKE
jgi:lysozyme